MSYSDERLVALYDLDNPDGPDHDFYRGLAERLDARRVVDLGCGTGILTVTLAGEQRTVVGVDPSTTMLRYARARPGGDRVEWVMGDSRAIAPARADLAVMTGNVAMHVPGEDWARTLQDLHDCLVPGGTLAFETRNPAARSWESWAADPLVRDTPVGRLTEWMEIDPPGPDGVLTYRAHNVFEATGEDLVETQELAFRPLEQVRDDLATAGLLVQDVHGGWDERPATDDEPLLVLVARRPAQLSPDAG